MIDLYMLVWKNAHDKFKNEERLVWSHFCSSKNLPTKGHSHMKDKHTKP